MPRLTGLLDGKSRLKRSPYVNPLIYYDMNMSVIH
jgi:hypothetical protein